MTNFLIACYFWSGLGTDSKTIHVKPSKCCLQFGLTPESHIKRLIVIDTGVSPNCELMAQMVGASSLVPGSSRILLVINDYFSPCTVLVNRA